MNRFQSFILMSPVRARHVKRTLLFSPEDDPGQASPAVIDLALKAAGHAAAVSLADVSRRMKEPPHWPDQWPGEHYRLLAGLVRELQPRHVVEIGTHTGLSALSMLTAMPKDSTLSTFDLVPWAQIPDTCLRAEDFAGGRLVQEIGDLGDAQVLERHRDVLRRAEFIFADGPKDGKFEKAFIAHLDAVDFVKPPWVLFDDIKDWAMLAVWRAIRHPKLDMTSLGHWTGTGLVHWTR